MFRFILAVLMLSTVIINARAQTGIPAEVFANLPVFDEPDLSPDGRYVAAKTSHGGKLSVGVFKVNTVADTTYEDPAMLYVEEPDYIKKILLGQ